jgi:hypothetical protein
MKISEHANYLLNEYGRLQFDYAFLCKPDGESLRNEARNNLEEYIAELEAAQRWIPVSERLPKDKKHYMAVVMNCYDGSRDIYRLRYYGNGDWFSWASEPNVVTHWKEEPALPEVQA